MKRILCALAISCAGCSTTLHLKDTKAGPESLLFPVSIPDQRNFPKDRYLELGNFDSKYGFALWQSLYPVVNIPPPMGSNQP